MTPRPKRLVSVGTSFGIIIPRAILILLRITRDTSLEITTDGISLTITPDHNHQPQKPPKVISQELEDILVRSFEKFEDYYRTNHNV